MKHIDFDAVWALFVMAIVLGFLTMMAPTVFISSDKVQEVISGFPGYGK